MTGETKEFWAKAWDECNPLKARLANEYLSRVNDYLSLEKYASDHSMTEKQASELLELGYEFHEQRVEFSRPR